MINVTKAFLPPFEEYTSHLRRAWDKAWITNQGELARELEDKLKAFFGVQNLLFTGNGTIVLQMALKALGITKEVITTPFSYVATTNAILWENCKPVFADIDPQTFCINPSAIEKLISKNTEAILATHVYGLPCNIDAIESIAAMHGLKVIYDAAHACGTSYRNRSLLDYGDISTCSFHATKLFHTVEGGCIICHDADLLKKLSLMRSFGHINDDYHSVGINAKNSEFHAAMGLALLPYVDSLIQKRKIVSDRYTGYLETSKIRKLEIREKDISFNYAYYPVVFESENVLMDVKDVLKENAINTRRYFYPSLNNLPFLCESNNCPVSEDISRRVLCLPLYPELAMSDVDRISSIILKVIK